MSLRFGTSPAFESIWKPPFSSIVVAPRFSGKTYLIVEMLNSKHFRSQFDNIIVFSPTINLDHNWDKLKDKEDLLLSDEFEETYIEKLLSHIEKQVKQKNKLQLQAKTQLNPDYYGPVKTPSTQLPLLDGPLETDIQEGDNDPLETYLIILDDLADKFRMDKSSVLNKLAIKSRHYQISYIFVSQKYRLLPPSIRVNSLVKVFFKINNQKEMDAISEELSSRYIPEDKLKELIDQSTKDYNYFTLKQGKNEEYYEGNLLNFKKIIV